MPSEFQEPQEESVVLPIPPTKFLKNEEKLDEGIYTFPEHEHTGYDSQKVGFGGGAGSSTIVGSISTTDATPTSVEILTLASPLSIVFVEARVICQKTSGTAGNPGDGAGYLKRATFKRDDVSGATILTMQQDAFTQRDDATWTADLVGSGNTIKLQVTGATNVTISWKYEIYYLYNT